MIDRFRHEALNYGNRAHAHLRKASILMLAVCLVVGLGPAKVGAADPFEIPAIVPLSGAGGFAGRDLQVALQGLEAYVNRTGGIRGRPVRFTFQDDQTSPQLSLQLVNGLIAKGAQAILGPALVGSCLAVAPIVQQRGPVEYCFSPGVYPDSGSFMFSAQIATPDLMRASASYFRSRGWTRIGFINTTDATGQDGEHQLDAALKLQANRSLSIVAREHYNGNDVSVSAQIAQIKAANPQVVVGWTTGAPFGTLLRGMQDAGLDVPVFTSSGNAVPAQIKQYEGFLPKELLIPGVGSQAPDEVMDRGQRRQIDIYLNEMLKIGVEADYVQLSSWDPGYLLVSAYRAKGVDATAEQIRAYLASSKALPAVDGTYNFQAYPQRGLGIDNIYIVHWDKTKRNWSGVSHGGGEADLKR